MAAERPQTITCAFCKGRRTDPYNLLSSLSQCEVCKGKGQVTVMGPHVACSYCRGTGSHKTFSCPVCKGKGVVAPLPEPTRVCSACGGLAYETSSGLYCLKCKGRGQVVA
jgi:DnaJ-class molecular chaperone